jgi:hypothetical protein
MGKNQDPGSGINILDPPHCFCHLCVLEEQKFFVTLLFAIDIVLRYGYLPSG